MVVLGPAPESRRKSRQGLDPWVYVSAPGYHRAPGECHVGFLRGSEVGGRCWTAEAPDLLILLLAHLKVQETQTLLPPASFLHNVPM